MQKSCRRQVFCMGLYNFQREKKKGRPVLNELVVRLISVPAKEIDFKQAENEIRQVEQNMSESWENDIYYQYL
ncbi:hypothetical protein EBB54_11880 [Schaedlerella arabinosiphila]|uniref:Uncharacterized protein n=1 Tax=Schaedlerella arabinosiphila TaxID=2044587 RepID=A0A3R8JM65_9FIRM|nr:hypothetical protein EBB54_11880 [Schaedlerella arabinosiphila]